ncbi:MAG: BACON domain-containing protein [Bacteroidales bacterium]|nr:BACON domain-containing protein [Bacteroidales bacterium]
MKNFSLMMLSVLVLLLLTGCSSDSGKETVIPDPTPVPDNITITTTTLTANAKGGDLKINFSTNAAWSATSDQSWCKLSPASGLQGSITVTASISENTSSESGRDANITLKAGTASKSVKISQEKLYMLNVSKDSCHIGFAGDTISFEVSSNTEYTIKSDSEWLKLKDSTAVQSAYVKKVTFEAQANTGQQERKAIIVLENKERQLKHSVTVKQDGCPADNTGTTGGDINDMTWKQ